MTKEQEEKEEGVQQTPVESGASAPSSGSSLLERLRERLQIRWGAPAKDGDVRAMVDYDDLRNAIGVLSAQHTALISAKQELWATARASWTMADFKNWAVIQQIDGALQQLDGKRRSGAPQ